MKAIDTVYNGYRFRSRLEARWAVFFHTLGVKYEYEREGYDLDGLWYLPDFYLPQAKPAWSPVQPCWIEIKPESPDPTEYMKAARLCIATRQPVFILVGAPDLELYFYNIHNAFVYFGPNSPPFDDEEDHHRMTRGEYPYLVETPQGYAMEANDDYAITHCPRCGTFGFTYSGWLHYLQCGCATAENDREYYKRNADDLPHLQAAYTAARQARFEFVGDRRH